VICLDIVESSKLKCIAFEAETIERTSI